MIETITKSDLSKNQYLVIIGIILFALFSLFLFESTILGEALRKTPVKCCLSKDGLASIMGMAKSCHAGYDDLGRRSSSDCERMASELRRQLRTASPIPPAQTVPVCAPKCTSECGGENDGCRKTCPFKSQGTFCTSRSLLTHACDGKGACTMAPSVVASLPTMEKKCIGTKGRWVGISNMVVNKFSRTDKLVPCDCSEIPDTDPSDRLGKYYWDLVLGCIPWVY